MNRIENDIPLLLAQIVHMGLSIYFQNLVRSKGSKGTKMPPFEKETLKFAENGKVNSFPFRYTALLR